MVQMNRFAGHKLRHMQRTNVWTPRGGPIRGGGGVMNWEIGIDMYTLMCIKWMTNKNLLYKKINKIKFKSSKKKIIWYQKVPEAQISRKGSLNQAFKNWLSGLDLKALVVLSPVVKGARAVCGAQWQNSSLNYHLQTLVIQCLERASL